MTVIRDRDTGAPIAGGCTYRGRTVRRSASPQPSRLTPTATTKPPSSPVRGSVEEDVDGSAGWVDGDALVVVAVLGADVPDEEVTADELDDELEEVDVG